MYQTEAGEIFSKTKEALKNKTPANYWSIQSQLLAVVHEIENDPKQKFVIFA